ncbi:hypothetical protein CR194_15755 [Salipaludibacillus keqinensis]|uniref:Uncharacterized protein n=1 Tax=Salipaludibacillus keqinensis TaxID=2045207 RepID=A0A323TA39_9BACI|nr:hypothetical protein [Salipaludibacillus keqinensis]PYZ92291.1 hypothetical protein CR194_15755 [Salipaludibacillus keqinensis]
MNQFLFGFLLLVFLALPPVANLLESIMIVHMHMQMPLLVIAGFLMAYYFQKKYPAFFEKWNQRGYPGILLFSIIMIYWMLPRAMDDALTSQTVEIFKYISLPFLAGVPLRDSWAKLTSFLKNIVIISFTIMFIMMGLLYIAWPEQLCNNYLMIEQITLGWGFITMAACMVIYLVYNVLIDPMQYEGLAE